MANGRLLQPSYVGPLIATDRETKENWVEPPGVSAIRSDSFKTGRATVLKSTRWHASGLALLRRFAERELTGLSSLVSDPEHGRIWAPEMDGSGD